MMGAPPIVYFVSLPATTLHLDIVVLLFISDSH
jgi:hypothetical protein